MKNNLFISSNALVTLISSIIIEEQYKNDCNILLIVTNHIEEKFLADMQKIAEHLKVFDKILFFNEYSDDMHINTTVTLNQAKEFNFKKFENKLGIDNFDNIYFSYFYFQGYTIANYYDNANIYAIENGTASYFDQNIDPKFLNRIQKLYSINYYNLFTPNLSRTNIQNVKINEKIIADKFIKISELVQIEEDNNSVIFCAHNFSLNKNLMSTDEEFKEYFRLIDLIIKKGYTVYFKEHPKTPNMLYSKLRSKLDNNKIKYIKNNMPTEAVALKLKPKAIVSPFSTSLLTCSYLFKIPVYTFKMTNNLKNMPIFQIAYALIMSYIPILDKNNINSEYNLVSDLPLNEIPLYNVVYNYHIRNFLSKKEFQKIHKNILHMQSENFIYFQIPKEFYEIFQKGDYWDFLNYNMQPYVQKIKTFYANNDKLTVTIEGIKILKEIF